MFYLLLYSLVQLIKKTAQNTQLLEKSNSLFIQETLEFPIIPQFSIFGWFRIANVDFR